MFHCGITVVLLRCYFELVDAGRNRFPDTFATNNAAEKTIARAGKKAT